MSRQFIAEVIGHAVHDEAFRRLLQHDSDSAADAMGMEYDATDLRILKGLQSEIEDLDPASAREYLREVAQQEQDLPDSPLRPHE